jgi:hypothetical protein
VPLAGSVVVAVAPAVVIPPRAAARRLPIAAVAFALARAGPVALALAPILGTAAARTAAVCNPFGDAHGKGRRARAHHRREHGLDGAAALVAQRLVEDVNCGEE